MIAAFDFDHTIINVNSDTYINKLVLKHAGADFKYPEHINQVYEKYGWTARMQAVFDYMQGEFQISDQDLIECIREIKIDDSMKDLFRLLKEKNYKLKIISDANTIFIETILKENGLETIFNMKEDIYTNNATFEKGRLKVIPFNKTYNSNGEPFDCDTKICTANICKGTVYKDLLKQMKSNENSIESNIYVGDGTNDYCPGVCLAESDKFFVKKGMSLFKRLQKSEYSSKIKCNIIYWTSANEIISNL